MIREETAMSVRQNLGDLLNQIKCRHDSVVITNAGKPVAALVDVELFEKIRAMKNHFTGLMKELGKAYIGVDHEIAQAEVNEALWSIRTKKTKK